MRFKQICNHPSHWLADGAYVPDDSGKFLRLAELCDEIASRQEKVLVPAAVVVVPAKRAPAKAKVQKSKTKKKPKKKARR